MHGLADYYAAANHAPPELPFGSPERVIAKIGAGHIRSAVLMRRRGLCGPVEIKVGGGPWWTRTTYLRGNWP